MKMRVFGMALFAAVVLAGAAFAADDEMSSGQEMMPPKPGPEAKALGSFFRSGATWTGEVPAGALGPDAPATTSHGKAVCHEILGGLWYVCDVEDVIGTGDQAITWKGHMVFGYDVAEGAYRCAVVDNMGTLANFDGDMDDDTFVLETPEPVMNMGQMMKDRLTWVKQDDGTMKFTDEHQVGDDEDWTMFESAVMKPLADDSGKMGKMKEAMKAKGTMKK